MLSRTIAALLVVVFPLSSASAADDAKQYIVGPSDVLAITVFGQPELSGKYLVQADGSVTFPLLERVTVGGLSMQEIENNIRTRLADGFLRNPQVGVTVDQYRSQQVIITGEVRSPGTLEFSGSLTLMSAVAKAGATTDRASHEALVYRRPAGAAPVAGAPGDPTQDAQVIRVNLEDLQRGVLSEDVVLRGGDTIVIPRAATVFVTGHVNSPNEYPIREGMTVRQVLALAGGVTERGSTGRIQAIRKIKDQDRTIDIRLQDVVEPNDTIVVRERFF